MLSQRKQVSNGVDGPPIACADVLIVGAGPAGCAAAYDLAQRGMRVLLLDKTGFPRVKPCAGGVTMKALNALRYPITPVIRQICRGMTLCLGFESRNRIRPKYPLVAMTVRAELDQFCLEKTLAIGAQFRKISPITAIDRRGTGWRLTTREACFESDYLIGADGANSRVRGLLNLDGDIRFGMAVETCLPLDSTPGEMEFYFGVVDRGYGWVFPKRDHLNVGIYSLGSFSKSALNRFCEGRFHTSLDETSEKILGHRIPYHGFRRPQHRPRAFLAGDAAGLIDPLLGEGIFNAIRSGQITAKAILDEAEYGATRYQRKIREVTTDLKSYWYQTKGFYWRVKWGYRALTFGPIKYGLAKGFALGWPVKRILLNFPLLPLCKPRNYLIDEGCDSSNGHLSD